MKEVEIIEAHAMPDPIHMLVRIPLKLRVSGFMGYLKGRSEELSMNVMGISNIIMGIGHFGQKATM